MSKEKTKTGIIVPVQVVYNPHQDKWLAETQDMYRNVTFSAKARTPQKAVKKLLKTLEENKFRWQKQTPYAGKLINSGITDKDEDEEFLPGIECKQEDFSGPLETGRSSSKDPNPFVIESRICAQQSN